MRYELKSNAGSRNAAVWKMNSSIEITGERCYHEKSCKIRWKFSCKCRAVSEVGDIIRSDESRRYVVPSAPGKRFDEDIKVTDMLYGCYDAASKGEDFSDKLKAIKERIL